MRITTEIDIDDVVSGFSCDEEAFDLIKNIDGCVADWEFTQKCAKYFIEQIAIGCKGRVDVINNYYEELKDMLK